MEFKHPYPHLQRFRQIYHSQRSLKELSKSVYYTTFVYKYLIKIMLQVLWILLTSVEHQDLFKFVFSSTILKSLKLILLPGLWHSTFQPLCTLVRYIVFQTVWVNCTYTCVMNWHQLLLLSHLCFQIVKLIKHLSLYWWKLTTSDVILPGKLLPRKWREWG